MKKIFLVFVVGLILVSCQEKSISEADQLGYRATIKQSNPSSGKSEAAPVTLELEGGYLPESVGAWGAQFTDDGLGNDEVAGDGIYTSVVNGIIISNEPSSSKGPGVSVTCDVEVISCNDSDCPYWGGCCIGAGPCTCLQFSDCSVTVSFEF